MWHRPSPNNKVFNKAEILFEILACSFSPIQSIFLFDLLATARCTARTLQILLLISGVVIYQSQESTDIQHELRFHGLP